MSSVKAPFAQCSDCPFQEQPFVPGSGDDGQVDVVIVGEAPGATEVQQKTPFVGPSGQVLQRVLDTFGCTSAWITNVVACHPPANKFDDDAAKCCHQRLIEEIKMRNPRVILALGGSAAEALLGAGPGITKRRGIMAHSEELDLPVMPTVHPAYVLRRPTVWRDFVVDVRKALRPQKATETEEHEGPDHWGVAFTAEEQLKTIDHFLTGPEDVVYDLETTGFDPRNDRIVAIVLANKSRAADVLYGEMLYDPQVKQALHNLFTSKRMIGHNQKFDNRFLLQQLGLFAPPAWDTMLGSYALDERRGHHGLKLIAMRTFGAPDWEEPLHATMEELEISSYGDVPPHELAEYAAWDGDYTFRLYLQQMDTFEDFPAQKELVEDLLLPASSALAEVENRGMLVDKEKVIETTREFERKIRELKKKLRHLSEDPELNPNSPQQVAHIMYDKLGLPEYQGRTTKKEVLERFKKKSPFCRMMLDYRYLYKRWSTDCKGIAKQIEDDGRVRTNFLLHGTRTGRLSSTNPNLQNVPWQPTTIRSFFIVPEDKIMVDIDFSQAELRILGYLAQEPFFIEAYQEGRDIHDEVAAMLFGKDFTKYQRTMGKSFSFGLIYGRGASAIAAEYGMSVHQAERLMERFMGRIPQARKWIAKQHRLVREQGYLETLYGRRRRFPLITSRLEDSIMRQAQNFPVQSIASDLTLETLIAMNDAGMEVISTVHDSIMLECDPGELKDILVESQRITRRIAENRIGDQVPFPIEAAVGRAWGNLKEVPMPDAGGK
ncbi:hypothetical protein GF373_17810 [bacterium]|nr:hypothetical protein [bacterium]